MMLTAWIMFENHTFAAVEGEDFIGLQQAITDAYEQEYDTGDKVYKGHDLIAGWGKVGVKGISCDEFCIVSGLHKLDELSLLDKADIDKAVNKKLFELDEHVKNEEHRLSKYKDLAWKLKQVRSAKDWRAELESM